MRSPLTVILAVAAILFLIVLCLIFALRGTLSFSPPTPSDPANPPAEAPAGPGGISLPAAQGMATFTPGPPTPEPPPATAPPPAVTETPVPPAPAAEVPATAVPPIPAAADAPPAPAPNANIQVSPVPAIPVIGSGASTGSNGNSGESGSSGGGTGGGAACGTRLIHVVRPGENLFRIGLRYNTTAYAIARLNGITNVRLVASGRRLVIVACARGSNGGGAQYTPRSSTYVVKPGDTLFRIALRFGLNTHYLCRVNGLTSNLIVPGQVLAIP